MINGIILAGGLSRRYGSCKSKLELENTRLLTRNYHLLSKFCDKVLVSCKEQGEIEGYPCLFDEFSSQAPMTGIYSALRYFQSPVLVLACDLPFMDEETLESLVNARNQAGLSHQNLYMTTFQKKDSDLIEALVAIYEPSVLNCLENALKQEKYSLFRAVPKENRHTIPMENSKAFFNINYQEDMQKAQELL